MTVLTLRIPGPKESPPLFLSAIAWLCSTVVYATYLAGLALPAKVADFIGALSGTVSAYSAMSAAFYLVIAQSWGDRSTSSSSQ